MYKKAIGITFTNAPQALPRNTNTNLGGCFINCLQRLALSLARPEKFEVVALKTTLRGTKFNIVFWSSSMLLSRHAQWNVEAMLRASEWLRSRCWSWRCRWKLYWGSTCGRDTLHPWTPQPGRKGVTDIPEEAELISNTPDQRLSSTTKILSAHIPGGCCETQMCVTLVPQHPSIGAATLGMAPNSSAVKMEYGNCCGVHMDASH